MKVVRSIATKGFEELQIATKRPLSHICFVTPPKRYRHQFYMILSSNWVIFKGKKV